MAHKHHGLAFAMTMESLEHLGFAQAVEIRRRFIQQHERREESEQRKRRIEKLRELRAEIHLELLDSFDAYLHGLAARNALRVRRAPF